ncbi:MAG: WYL domain-containing protein [Chryseotalea sp.]
MKIFFMPVNRNALIRYRTIDNCLKNRQRSWTLEDLIDACSEALYEYEGIDKGVSRRTVQMDLQLMRSDKLGYNAPILVLENKYYTYEDPAYSITNIPLTDQDLGKLTEVIEILRQFKGFSHFHELSGMVQRLESKVYSAKTNTGTVIDFEKNENLKGIEHIDTLYKAIINKKAILLKYQSFKARSANDFVFHPYYLKEYRNRWFVLGVKKRDSPILNLALDRILSIEDCSLKYITRKDFKPEEYFKHVIGVSVSPNARNERVLFYADRETAPYIVTKPLHSSQEIIEATTDGTTFAINVQLNFELEREILGFGNRIRVLAPEYFRRQIKENLSQALDQYNYDLNPGTLTNQIKKIEKRGFALFQHVFTRKEINHLRNQIYIHLKDEENWTDEMNLLDKMPTLKTLLLNKNLNDILKRINSHITIKSAHYITLTDIKIETAWKQEHKKYSEKEILLMIALDDLTEKNGATEIIPGSQNKVLSNQEIKTITNHSIPTVCEVNVGGTLFLNPNTLQRTQMEPNNNRDKRLLKLYLSE